VAILLICTVITISFFNGEKQEVSEKKQEVREKKQKDFYSAETIEKQIDAEIAEENEKIAKKNAGREVRYGLSQKEKFDLSQKEKKAIIDYLLFLQETTGEKHTEGELGSLLLHYIGEYKKEQKIAKERNIPFSVPSIWMKYVQLLQRCKELDVYVVNLIHINKQDYDIRNIYTNFKFLNDIREVLKTSLIHYLYFKRFFC
jgi:hypothetical protein